MTATVRRGRCKTRRRRGVATAVLLVLAAAGAAGAGAAAQAAEPVDLELVLAVDTSGSIDLEEARLQRDGYIAALGDDRVISTILSGPLGRVALSYVEWGGAEQQSTLIDWTLIDDKESARGFAARLVSAPNVRATRTSISAAMDYIVPMFASNEFVGSRRVIDISGDGPNNSGRLVNLARDWAVASGITVNGLPVINDRPNRYGLPGLPDLDLYFENCVIGGPGAFYLVADDFNAFAATILRKLILEIAGRRPTDAPAARVRLAAAFGPSCNVGERRFEEYFGR